MSLGGDGCAVAGKALEDLVGGLVPDGWGGVFVPGGGPCCDVGGEFFHVVVGRALPFLDQRVGSKGSGVFMVRREPIFNGRWRAALKASRVLDTIVCNSLSSQPSRPRESSAPEEI